MTEARTEITHGLESFKNAKIRKVQGPTTLGEGPYWDRASRSLFYVDILGKAVHRYVPSTGFHKKLELKDTVSVIVPVKGTSDKYILALGTKLVELTWDGKTAYHKLEDLITLDTPEETRTNDGKVDHLGNLWIGTMALEKDSKVEEKQGQLFRFSPDGRIQTVEKCVTISNGIAWNINRDLMYYIDSTERRVDVFDYESETGQVCNRRPFFDFNKNSVNGLPDGMTTDCDDNLWIACWGASQIVKVSGRTQIVLGLLKFPVERITSLTFGGEDMNVLYVTSMRHGLKKEQLEEQPEAGCVYEVTGLGVSGAVSHPGVLLSREERLKLAAAQPQPIQLPKETGLDRREAKHCQFMAFEGSDDKTGGEQGGQQTECQKSIEENRKAWKLKQEKQRAEERKARKIEVAKEEEECRLSKQQKKEVGVGCLKKIKGEEEENIGCYKPELP